MKRIVPLFALSLAAIGVASAQTIVRAPAAHTSAVNAAEMYKAYCAVCHGITGNGDGPAAAAMKTPPTNLTQLAARNKGKFPSSAVTNSIIGDITMPEAHGTQEMPVWGEVFRTVSHGNSEVQQRIANLVQYVREMQSK
ncbi:MAG: c-type cytochrome [Bryobacteraceae bacterium]